MALETAAILKIIDLIMDGTNAAMTLMQKNQKIISMFQKAVEEGRVPTAEEHNEIRESMEASLNALKDTYKGM